MIYIYKLTCQPTGRVYVGQTVDLQERWRQHSSSPPSRMAADAAAHRPFGKHFLLQVVAEVGSQHSADLTETALIRRHHLTGSRGYNSLDAAPSMCQRYHAMARSKAAAKCRRQAAG